MKCSAVLLLQCIIVCSGRLALPRQNSRTMRNSYGIDPSFEGLRGATENLVIWPKKLVFLSFFLRSEKKHPGIKYYGKIFKFLRYSAQFSASHLLLFAKGF